MSEAQEFWDELYGARERVWSGRVNPWLAETAAPLSPGRALDLGCGEGGDTVWLAEHGWHVTAVDISPTALDRAAAAAEAAGVTARIDFQRHDLLESFPDGEFDLVSAQFLQSPLDFDRDTVLRRAVAAVAPGGVLIVVDHGAAPPWAHEMARKHRFLSVDEVIDPIGLDPAEWQRVRAEPVERSATGPDGEAGTLLDNVIVLRRVTH
ncbi:class I SAM-dependent methyltransferase [Mycolicibacterium arseniciresistens]|uniref:Class I SAM-dependent methyltransferase n=1 Tax=Mycolicibacterium arseniciresistens TaxID=3062257 RepID=A0ABT8UGN0_9MYCO|nr:class I SAM-dependent methyltransferase [Mycolicibacterium arseniciresistens]MDO3636938.1 class I SAM-dependent methyltransferase [Mycolicibacterium arseniciresistens]